MTTFGLTPIRPATRGFSAVARMARPRRVRCTSSSRPTMMTADRAMTTSLVTVTMAGPTAIGSAGSSCGIAQVVAAPDDHGHGLQQDRDADGGDQRRQARRVAQRPVGDALDQQAEQDAHDDRRGHADDHQPPARQRGQQPVRQRDGAERGERPDHQHVAVGEVDQVHDPVDHRVAQRDERIQAAQHETVEDLLQESVERTHHVRTGAPAHPQFRRKDRTDGVVGRGIKEWPVWPRMLQAAPGFAKRPRRAAGAGGARRFSAWSTRTAACRPAPGRPRWRRSSGRPWRRRRCGR